MKYTITAACGHEVYVQLFGPTKQREYKIRQIESEDCLQCKLDKVQKRDKSLNIPMLEGSPKQIIWASNIRWKLILYWKRIYNTQQDRANKIMDIIYSHKDCIWWIDNRFNIDRL